MSRITEDGALQGSIDTDILFPLSRVLSVPEWSEEEFLAWISTRDPPYRKLQTPSHLHSFLFEAYVKKGLECLQQEGRIHPLQEDVLGVDDYHFRRDAWGNVRVTAETVEYKKIVAELDGVWFYGGARHPIGLEVSLTSRPVKRNFKLCLLEEFFGENAYICHVISVPIGGRQGLYGNNEGPFRILRVRPPGYVEDNRNNIAILHW